MKPLILIAALLPFFFLCGCQKNLGMDHNTESTPKNGPEEKKTPQSKPPYIGHTLSEAKKLATQLGFTIRMMRMNGEGLVGTTDFVHTRIDVAVENDNIVPW